MKPAILILGATGTIGRAVVAATVEAGWPVVAVARDIQALEELRASAPGADLQTLTGTLNDDAAAAELVASLERTGRPFAGVISALGAGGERGRLLDQPAELLRQSLDETVVPQLAAARHLLPWLAASGRNCGYVLVGGPGGRNPWAGYGHRSVAAAAMRMLAQVLHDEARAFSVRLQLLEVDSPVRTEANRQHACPQWPDVAQIGRKALALIENRNNARCTQAVIDYRNDACQRRSRSSVETAAPRSSESEEAAVREPSPPVSPAPSCTTTPAPQEMDSDASLLPARCLQDVRKLLQTFTPTKKNQESKQ